MLVPMLIVQVALANCEFNIKENSARIKDLLIKYKCTVRIRRSVCDTELTKYADDTLKFFKDTERYGEFLRYYDVNQCPSGEMKNNSSYVKRHILEGLLVDADVPESHWNEYKSVFNKSYPTTTNEASAERAWRNNLQLVAEHNKKYLKGRRSYALHLNNFADTQHADYIRNFLKLIRTARLHDPAEDLYRITYHSSALRRVPKQMDWRELGYRPRREEQWRCGACYAFAVAHALQAQMFKKHRKWRELSPQQIIDCSGADGNAGCAGGSLRAALRYVAREGLQYERDYPYFGWKGLCLYNRRKITAQPKRWAMLPKGNELAMEKALAHIGPLAVGINASPRSFQLYRSGIYDDPMCVPYQLNHAMLLVGYTPQYWILLNWWGPRWGENGYIRIRRGFNRCGVANMAAYVEIL